jgi:hypothetical protein
VKKVRNLKNRAKCSYPSIHPSPCLHSYYHVDETFSLLNLSLLNIACNQKPKNKLNSLLISFSKKRNLLKKERK